MAKYIINHGGLLHIIADEEFNQHIQLASRLPTKEQPQGSFAREATPAEVAAWYAAQGLIYDPATGFASVPAPAPAIPAPAPGQPAAAPAASRRAPTSVSGEA